MIDAITRHHKTINDYINFETLIPLLNKYKIFTKVQMKYFANKYHSDSDKVTNLIEWLDAKNGIGIHNFVRALKEAEEHSGHLVIVENLHKNVCISSSTP